MTQPNEQIKDLDLPNDAKHKKNTYVTDFTRDHLGIITRNTTTKSDKSWMPERSTMSKQEQCYSDMQSTLTANNKNGELKQ